VTKPKGVFSHTSQNAVCHIALGQIVFYCLMDSEPEIPHTHRLSHFLFLCLSFTMSHYPFSNDITTSHPSSRITMSSISPHTVWPQHWQVWPHLRSQRFRHSWHGLDSHLAHIIGCEHKCTIIKQCHTHLIAHTVNYLSIIIIIIIINILIYTHTW